MGWKCVVLLVIAAVFGGGVGWAEDPLLGSVDALVKAYEAGDAAAFETAVAGAKASSVWVYAGELLKQGRHDVALRLARQLKGRSWMA